MNDRVDIRATAVQKEKDWIPVTELWLQGELRNRAEWFDMPCSTPDEAIARAKTLGGIQARLMLKKVQEFLIRVE